MKLGIGTYAYAWSIGFLDAMPEEPMDAFGLLDRAEELEVGVVQYGPNLPLDELPPSDLKMLLRRASARGIVVEIGTRGLDPMHLAKQVRLAEQTGSPVLRWSIDVSDSVLVSAREVAACIQRLLPDLEKRKVRLAIENSQMLAKDLAELVQSTESPWVGVTLDTVNSLAIPEGANTVIATLAPHVASLHIKDFLISRMWHRMGFVVEGRPAGQGQLDVPGLLATVQAAATPANAILELWPPEQKTGAETVALEHQWVLESISYLRRYISN